LCAFIGLEAQQGEELLLVAFLVNVVLALPHARHHLSVQQDVVPGLEDPLVLGVFVAESLDALVGEADPLPPRPQVALDPSLSQKLEDALGCRLLAYSQCVAQLARRDGDVIMHPAHERDPAQRDDETVLRFLFQAHPPISTR
jgi:hypothetical protein